MKQSEQTNYNSIFQVPPSRWPLPNLQLQGLARARPVRAPPGLQLLLGLFISLLVLDLCFADPDQGTTRSAEPGSPAPCPPPGEGDSGVVVRSYEALKPMPVCICDKSYVSLTELLFGMHKSE